MCIFSGKRILGYLFFTLVETVYMVYMKPTWKAISVRLFLYAAMLLLRSYLEGIIASDREYKEKN